MTKVFNDFLSSSSKHLHLNLHHRSLIYAVDTMSLNNVWCRLWITTFRLNSIVPACWLVDTGMKAEDFWLLTFDLALQHVKVTTPGKTPVTVQVHGEVLHEWSWGIKVTEFVKHACSYVLDCLRYCPFSLASFKLYDRETRRQWQSEFSNSLKFMFTTIATNLNNLFGRIYTADADVPKHFITSTSILINPLVLEMDI